MSKHSIFIDNRLYIGVSTTCEGYGVFTNGFIEKNTIVEVSHIIKIPNDEIRELIDARKSELSDYVWGIRGYLVIALGFGSIYNHADVPNVDHSFPDNTIQFKTAVDVHPGQELFVSYGEVWWLIRNKQPVNT